MAVTEESRHRLYRRLEDVLGEEQATTLMEHLPPVGWADVATKRDLDVFARDLRSEMATLASDLRTEMGELRVELARDQRQLLFAFVLANCAQAGVVLGALQLA